MSLSTLPTTHIEIINPPKRVVFLQKQKIIFQHRGSQGSIMPNKKHHKKGSRVPIDFIITDKKRFVKKKWFIPPKVEGPSQSRRGPPKVEGWPGKMKQFVSMDHWVFWTSRPFLSSPTNRLVSLDFVKFQPPQPTKQIKSTSCYFCTLRITGPCYRRVWMCIAGVRGISKPPAWRSHDSYRVPKKNMFCMGTKTKTEHLLPCPIQKSRKRPRQWPLRLKSLLSWTLPGLNGIQSTNP